MHKKKKNVYLYWRSGAFRRVQITTNRMEKYITILIELQVYFLKQPGLQPPLLGGNAEEEVVVSRSNVLSVPESPFRVPVYTSWEFRANHGAPVARRSTLCCVEFPQAVRLGLGVMVCVYTHAHHYTCVNE